MTAAWLAGIVGVLVCASLVAAGEGLTRAAVFDALSLVDSAERVGKGRLPVFGRDPFAASGRRRIAPWLEGRRRFFLSILAFAPAGYLGARLAGPVGVFLGIAAAVLVPAQAAHRHTRNRTAELERQLCDAVETCDLAVRAGLSIVQATEFAAEEAEDPLRSLMAPIGDEMRLGMSFEEALQRFGDAVGTEDARLFVLVVTTHVRSGGNLSRALGEVAGTIRHRIEVRRELRALSAQARVSGAILGSLPIAFFVVLAGTSQRDLGPVYRSPAGIAMVVAGLVLEAIAYVWIRRLVRVDL